MAAFTEIKRSLDQATGNSTMASVLTFTEIFLENFIVYLHL